MRRAQRLPRVAVRLEGNEELVVIAVPDFPFANKVSATRIRGEFGVSELNAINVGSKFLAVAVFVDNRVSLHIDARNLGHCEALPAAVFEHDDDWVAIVRGRRVRFRKGGRSQQKESDENSNETTHKMSSGLENSNKTAPTDDTRLAHE
jgi:hypothetical protein